MRCAIGCALTALLGVGAMARPADGETADRAAITKAAEAFVQAFQKGDATAVAACWTSDGDLVDASGRVLKGRAAIGAEFAQLFADQKGLTVRIEVGAVSFPTPDTAVEDGVSSVMPADGGAPSRARYTNHHVKKDGKWLLASVRETEYVPAGNYAHLRPLEWTIGEWVDASAQEHAARVMFEWTADGNFIIASRAVDVKGVLLEHGSERIGWDPAAKQIRSWSFASDGGFGESAWTREQDTWHIRSSSVLQSGGLMTATNSVTRVDADTITWQAKDQQLNGKAVPDSPVITMKRLK